jgi:hypothetical protein
VPLTILQGPLSISASANLGDFGPAEGEPTVVQWGWYYHSPSFAGWALILALFLLLKENRTWQAWTILIPFFLLGEIAWPWLERGLSLPHELGYAWHWLITAWTVIWLLSPWLSRRRPIAAYFLALGLAAVIGIVAGVGVSENWSPVSCISLGVYGLGIFALLSAISLSGKCCRKRYRPRLFMVWLVPSLIVGSVAGLTMTIATLMITIGGVLLPHVFEVLFIIVVEALIVAAVLYLLNLPFMILVFRCPLYRERFQRLLRLSEVAPAAAGPFDIAAESTTPTAVVPAE